MEPTPPELGAATGSPHGLIVEGREELLYLLGEAAELEHAACCIYLYAAFTLRAEPGDGLTAAQVPAVAGWKRGINRIALQEMIHLALVNNLLAALGGAPRLGRHNLPQRSPYAPEIRLTLAPFSEQTLRRFLYIERPEGMDISSIAGELDHDRLVQAHADLEETWRPFATQFVKLAAGDLAPASTPLPLIQH